MATSSWPCRRQTRTLRRGAAAGSLGEPGRGAVSVLLLTRAGGGGGGESPQWITPRSAATLRFIMKEMLFGEDRSAKKRDLPVQQQVHLPALLHLAKSTAATRTSATIGTTTGGTRCANRIPSRLLFVSKTSSIGFASSAAGFTLFKNLMKGRRAAAHVWQHIIEGGGKPQLRLLIPWVKISP